MALTRIPLTRTILPTGATNGKKAISTSSRVMRPMRVQRKDGIRLSCLGMGRGSSVADHDTAPPDSLRPMRDRCRNSARATTTKRMPSNRLTCFGRVKPKAACTTPITTLA